MTAYHCFGGGLLRATRPNQVDLPASFAKLAEVSRCGFIFEKLAGRDRPTEEPASPVRHWSPGQKETGSFKGANLNGQLQRATGVGFDHIFTKGPVPAWYYVRVREFCFKWSFTARHMTSCHVPSV